MNGTSPTRSKRASRASGQARDLALGDEERGLGRVALDRPLAVVLLAQHGVVGEAAAAEHDAHLVAQRPVAERLAVDAQLAFGPVADAGDVDLARGA